MKLILHIVSWRKGEVICLCLQALNSELQLSNAKAYDGTYQQGDHWQSWLQHHPQKHI